MRSLLMTLVAALALLSFTGTQVYAAGKGHTPSKQHSSKAKKGGKKKSAKKGGKRGQKKKGDRKKKDERKRHEDGMRR